MVQSGAVRCSPVQSGAVRCGAVRCVAVENDRIRGCVTASTFDRLELIGEGRIRRKEYGSKLWEKRYDDDCVDLVGVVSSSIASSSMICDALRCDATSVKKREVVRWGRRRGKEEGASGELLRDGCSLFL